MRYLQQHITTILTTYDGSLPLAHFLKHYFRRYPKLGSRDRKILSAMVYGWYRISKGLGNYSIDQWFTNSMVGGTDNYRQWIDAHGEQFDISRLFPYDIELSTGITRENWLLSMLVQPNLFIRIRKNKEFIIKLLEQHNISFTSINTNCLSLPNGAKIDSILPEDCYAVQDASSQRTGTFFHPQKGELWYDCCSGAGGKSLLLTDLEPGIKLIVSDKRKSIIHNLQQRFQLYRLPQPIDKIIDVSDEKDLNKSLTVNRFDNIICDVPCSGSGTWARTPEQLYFFDKAAWGKFPLLQKAIATNIAAYLKPGGRLIYITCSVFRQENEDVVEAVTQQTGLKLIQSQIINGTGIKADSMFVAELTQ